ncbi:hypothetical protein SS1G_04243 [Sclerotinia sclerotiorum 1980 UF-70]|uniref:RING-type E3 ubiquitin transferase n=1 Tax=Sclerotinia sclerotiorum (strain ATCC 18683 / 1980 / Ss-1) TaxID=665079 RepID=A7EG02_SCLS1|nr:hypothetical protein SS1G_04243 [Sclerotinia sclerotiorum 1980 UF-70]EDO01768.1 hypothetical protein SS1G_04243 [Sclerotinia sclerotiorum 1980 UF-70]
MDEQWDPSVGGRSNSSAPPTSGSQPIKSPSRFPRSHFYTEGSDSGEDSHMLGFVGPSSSEDNFNSQVMVEPGEESEAGTASRVNLRSSPQTEIEGDIEPAEPAEPAMDDQATVQMGRGSDGSNSSEGASVRSVRQRQNSSRGKAPVREDSLGHSISTGEGRTNTLEFGGGDRVRLCNPCVPDPNIAPPQTNQTGSVPEPRHNLGYHGRTQSSIVPTTSIPGSLPAEPRFRLADHRSHTVPEEFQNWYRERAALSSGQNTRSRSSTVTGTGRDTTEDMVSRQSAMKQDVVAKALSQFTFLRNVRGPSPSVQSPPNAPVPNAGRRYVVSGGDLRSRPLPRPPQIQEEDECPICHHELPSSSLANSETLRSEHIISCINRATSRLSTGTPSSTPTPPIPSTTRPALPITQTSAQSSSSRVSASSTSALPHPLVSTPSSGPSQPRRTGVFPYVATEKDCQDDAECQICLEEYEPGVEMGRLECFCRFHLSCIRKWFEKHPGRCPMHQHDEYGY